jgi:hypothetical protein
MNMHVPSASSSASTVALPWNVRHVEPVTDARIEADKAANRGLVVDRLLGILQICSEEAQATGDPRYLDLEIRAIDRLARILRLHEPQQQELKGSPELDRLRMVTTVAAGLDELAAKIGEGS